MSVSVDWWMPGAIAVLAAVAAWAAKKVVAKLETHHADRDKQIMAKLSEITAQQVKMAESQHRFELVITELRGELRHTTTRLDGHDEDRKASRAASSTLHARIDALAERTTRAETRMERDK